MALAPYYDTDTKNLSFIQTAMDLKTLGIKNNIFFLALYDRSLVGVDPYSNCLSVEMQMRIVTECIVNPWYFLREVARIPDQGGTGIPFQLNRGNLASAWCFFNSIDHYLCIPRQIGKTQSTIALIDWVFHFGTTRAQMMFLNKTETDSINNLNRLKDQRDLLPSYMQQKFTYREDGTIEKETNNVKKLSNNATHNEIIVKGKAASIEAADGLGRGLTQPIQLYDEIEFTPFIKTIMEAAGPAYRSAADNSERNHAPHCRILISTPGDLDSQPGKDAEEIRKLMCQWSEKFYDWDPEEVRQYVKANSANRIMYIEYQYYQLGKDEKYFEDTCAFLNNNRLKIRREIFLERMHGSENSPFDPADIALLGEKKGKVIEEYFINQYYKLNVYSKINRSEPYIVGVDVGNGYGQDNTAIIVYDAHKERVVADFSSSVIGIPQLERFLISLIKNYIPYGILCIERNMNGESVIAHLKESSIHGNVYFDSDRDLVADGIDEKLDAQGFLQREAQRRMLYGVSTNTKSRKAMMALLERYVIEEKDSFVSPILINQVFKLVIDKKGKIAAASGEHDDSVMAFLMCLYVLHYGNNLANFGFVKGKVPTNDEANRGLFQDESYMTPFSDELSDATKTLLEQNKYQTVDDYNAERQAEMARAKLETMYMDRFSNVDKHNVVVRQMDTETSTSVGMGASFFDFLNS